MDYLNYVMIALVVILTIVVIWLLSKNKQSDSSGKKTGEVANDNNSEDNTKSGSSWSGSSKKN